MWIAKPLSALTPLERSTWLESQAPDRPLAQTLVWSEAIESAGGNVLIIYNPSEKVGGVVHCLPQAASGDGGLDFECTNGPLLNWDDANASRHLATFAMAAAKASSKFASLTLRPRWVDRADIESVVKALPVPSSGFSKAATMVLDVQPTREKQRAGFSSRLRRTLETSEEMGAHATRVSVTPELPESLEAFVTSMRAFGQERGFFVPDHAWFKRLVFGHEGNRREDIRFLIIDSQSKPQSMHRAQTQLLCCIHGRTAHFLFGWDRKPEDTPSSLSTAALAHACALEILAQEGVSTYDLNGYIDPDDPANAGHPYAGAARFKAQFNGRVIRYMSPEFKITRGPNN